MSKVEFVFERCSRGIRVVVFRDYYDDGEREVSDIIEKSGDSPIKQSREVFNTLEHLLWSADIITFDGKSVFDDFDFDHDRKTLEKMIRTKFKEILEIPVEEARCL